MKLRIILIVLGCSLVYLPFNIPAKKKINGNTKYFVESFNHFNKSNVQQTELYTEILEMIKVDKKKENIEIDMNTELDSLLICFDKIQRYIEGKVIKIFYHDSENVYFSFYNFYQYLEENNYKSINTCSADGPDGTDQVYLKNRILLLITGQWDGGDDSDTTYIPSKYFQLSFYIMDLNESDSVIISNIDR